MQEGKLFAIAMKTRIPSKAKGVLHLHEGKGDRGN